MCRWGPHPVFSVTSLFSNTITLHRRITTTAVARCSCCTHENCMHAEQIIIIFYVFLFILCSMYLVLFLIVLYRTIVTVCTDIIFLYNYLLQIYQIIHLSPVGCFNSFNSIWVNSIKCIFCIKKAHVYMCVLIMVKSQ